MNYKIENEIYIANDGYVFENKKTKWTFKGLRLGLDDNIDNYNVIEEPIEEIFQEGDELNEEICEICN